MSEDVTNAVISVGDIVYLKSGSPPMTVELIDQLPSAPTTAPGQASSFVTLCRWFDSNGNVSEHKFALDVLTKERTESWFDASLNEAKEVFGKIFTSPRNWKFK